MNLYKHKVTGTSLIELVVFIVVIGIICTGIITASGIGISPKMGGNVLANTTALNIANSRMQIILGQKAIYGFNANVNALDICDSNTTPTPSPYCPNTVNGVFTVLVTQAGVTGFDPNSAQIITVQVTGAGTAKLTSMEGNG